MDNVLDKVVSYKIVRQMIDHIYGSDTDFDEDEFITIYRTFYGLGGSWEKLLGGDMHQIVLLEETLDKFFQYRSISSIATRISCRVF